MKERSLSNLFFVGAVSLAVVSSFSLGLFLAYLVLSVLFGSLTVFLVFLALAVSVSIRVILEAGLFIAEPPPQVIHLPATLDRE